MGKARRQCDRTLAFSSDVETGSIQSEPGFRAANPAAAAAIACPAMSVPRAKGLICCAFCLARHLLAIGNKGNSRVARHCEVLIMLMALGAASAAWDVVKSIGSQASSSSQSTGFFGSGSDPFTMSGSDSAEPGSKKSSNSGSGKLSPAAMEAMLAAQGQFSMSASNSSGLNSASLTPADTSSLAPISLDASSSSASYNATGMMLQRAQLMSAVA
jgi:hypothetical protein